MVERRSVATDRVFSESLDQVFAALADPTRRAILGRLRMGDASVGEIAAPFEISFAAVSKHLHVLERAGLVSREAVGRQRRCRLEARAMEAAADWTQSYRAFWEGRLDALEAHLADRSKRGGAAPARKRRKK